RRARRRSCRSSSARQRRAAACASEAPAGSSRHLEEQKLAKVGEVTESGDISMTAANATGCGDPIDAVKRAAEVGERFAIGAQIGHPILLARTQRSADLLPLPQSN